ncbi:hypothetical protein CEUSTIGMA_g373.t1 [Chlamydomonas eustigma]|uniref:Uncharacterized protein n=1 Tax=Chlamydomonas eustigma TaxID=1157962 RepID=A0A250WQ13_9CHLO|nr:hypothetical protein CEUSTIGMA_g373.t1 [Chlamydomonas eustigma]|eukprot:GAX72918.1 hypothetical protein CEUSTIGMA_g373.t1 [Chlamydomonas eustigma]
MQPTKHIWSAEDKQAFVTRVVRHPPHFTLEAARKQFWTEWRECHIEAIQAMEVPEAVIKRLQDWVTEFQTGKGLCAAYQQELYHTHGTMKVGAAGLQALYFYRAQARKAILECSAFKGTMEERVEQYTAMLYVVHNPLHATKPEEGKDVPDSDVARKIVKEIHGKAHGISCIKLLEKQKKEERKAMKTDDKKKRNKNARRLRK